MNVSVELREIERVCMHILQACGVPAGDAKLVTDSIIDAHRRGKGTHGIGRLPIYVRKIRSGQMSPRTGVAVVTESPAVAVIDALNGFGQVAAGHAMRMAMDRAVSFGLGAVGVRNSNSFGAAGYIAEMAASNGMIGVVLGNAGPAIVPTGGRRPVLGTNPLAVAFPGGALGFPISLDMATSAVARSKIRHAAKSGAAIPEDWALDEEGNPTGDPVAALKGSLMPLGGAKGYGLSLAIDILAGLLSGAAFGGVVKPLNCPEGYSNCGHLIVAISISSFMDISVYEEKLSGLVKNIRQSGDSGRVMLPGESSHLQKCASDRAILLPVAVAAEIDALCLDSGLEARLSGRGIT